MIMPILQKKKYPRHSSSVTSRESMLVIIFCKTEIELSKRRGQEKATFSILFPIGDVRNVFRRTPVIEGAGPIRSFLSLRKGKGKVETARRRRLGSDL